MRVYFNKNFTGTAAQIRAMQYTGHDVIVSHTDPGHAMIHAAQTCSMTHFTEPANLKETEYLSFLEEALAQHRIDAFIPGKFVEVIAALPDRFPQAVVPATPETIALINHKAHFMTDWPEDILPLPRWGSFRTLEEFDALYEQLRQDGVRLCMKPAQGIYASGFRMLSDQPRVKSFLNGELYEMSTAAARELIAAAPEWPDYLLMHTLVGMERSVDCAALNGELLGCVVRRKDKDAQYIECREDLHHVAQAIARRYRLSGMFNFQTRDDKAGTAHMLEINTRASGGIRNALASGVNLPGLLFDALEGVRRPGVLTPRQPMRIKEDSHARRV